MYILSFADTPVSSNDMPSNWRLAGMAFSVLAHLGLADEHLQRLALLLERDRGCSWILVLTDGKPNLDGFDDAVARLNATESARGVTVFAVGAGPKVDYQQLARLSAQRSPAPLEGLKYEELFEWLSASLSNVSNSSEFGRDDRALESMRDRVPLPSVSGWTSA